MMQALKSLARASIRGWPIYGDERFNIPQLADKPFSPNILIRRSGTCSEAKDSRCLPFSMYVPAVFVPRALGLFNGQL